MNLSVVYNSLIFSFLVIIGISIVQALLSSLRYRFLGLILPLASFVFSLVAIFYFNGLVGNHGLEGAEELGYYALQFGIGNLPTLILLIIRSIFKRDSNRTKKSGKSE